MMWIFFLGGNVDEWMKEVDEWMKEVDEVMQKWMKVGKKGSDRWSNF